MSDQNFHEIQLSGKQLIFLFMCAVVVTVVVFLFGVSVGRGVRGPATETAQAAAAPTIEQVPAPASEPTQAPANELSYAEALEGEPPTNEPPPAPVEEPVVDAPRPAPSSPAQSAEARPAEPAPPAKTAARSVAPLRGWVVLVGAYTARDVATREAAKLQGKGYPAFVFTEPPATPGPHFKVRVGPYSGRPDAESMLRTLTKEGYKPLLKR
jgi:cell division protein FtsN